MKIVIEVSEYDYRKVQDGRASVSMMRKAIRNGTPLPKGHGRLKDESDIVAQSVHYFNGTKTLGQCLDDCPTIIEADKEGAEE